MFRTVPLSIISFSLYTQQWYMSYRPSWSCSQAVSKPVSHILLLCVQWKTDGGQRNCPKHVEFYSKNKFEKLVQLVGFIIRIYHDARSLKCQIHIVALLAYLYGVPSSPLHPHPPLRGQRSKQAQSWKIIGSYTGVAKDTNILDVSKDHTADIFRVQQCKAYT